jgi:hypothetical protein
MKNIILAVFLILVLVSCNSNDSHIKYSYSFTKEGDIKREMITKNATSDIEIKMEGTASFTADGTNFKGLTKGGFIEYRNKETELKVSYKNNGLAITIEQNGRKISNTSDTVKEIIAEAIRDIKKVQEKYK